jgi:hypothetical protein
VTQPRYTVTSGVSDQIGIMRVNHVHGTAGTSLSLFPLLSVSQQSVFVERSSSKASSSVLLIQTSHIQHGFDRVIDLIQHLVHRLALSRFTMTFGLLVNLPKAFIRSVKSFIFLFLSNYSILLTALVRNLLLCGCVEPRRSLHSLR